MLSQVCVTRVTKRREETRQTDALNCFPPLRTFHRRDRPRQFVCFAASASMTTCRANDDGMPLPYRRPSHDIHMRDCDEGPPPQAMPNPKSFSASGVLFSIAPLPEGPKLSSCVRRDRPSSMEKLGQPRRMAHDPLAMPDSHTETPSPSTLHSQHSPVVYSRGTRCLSTTIQSPARVDRQVEEPCCSTTSFHSSLGLLDRPTGRRRIRWHRRAIGMETMEAGRHSP